MKTIYLIRHGSPDFPNGIKLCIGKTDLSLNEEGRSQAEDLRDYFIKNRIDFYCFSSPLKRAKETAELISCGREITFFDELSELDMGDWEARPLKDIKKGLRDRPRGGENIGEALNRINKIIKKIINIYQDDKALVIVGHAGIISLFLSNILGIPLSISRSLPQAYGCINKLEYSESGYSIKMLGEMPRLAPGYEGCIDLLKKYKASDDLINHGKAVSKIALKIEKNYKKISLKKEGDFMGKKDADPSFGDIKLSGSILGAAGLLHDIGKGKKNHALDGAYIIRKEGYPELSDVIRFHQDLENPLIIDEKSILFYSDKLVEGDEFIEIEEKFSKKWDIISESSDVDRDVQDAFYRRYRHSLILDKKLRPLLDE